MKPGPDVRVLEPGQTIDVVVEKGVYRGLGLAHHEGQVVFVPRALPGERWRARVASVGRGYVNAVGEALLEGAAGRRESPCPYSARCGGCAYQEADYPRQLEIKSAILRESLARAGVEWAAELPVAASPEQGWRTRATLHFDASGDRLLLGLHEQGSRRVVDVERCLQLSDAMNRAARDLLAALTRHPARARGVRDALLAESGDGSRLVVALHLQGSAAQALALAGVGEVPGLTGFGVLLGSSSRGAARRERYVSLRGEPFVETQVRGVLLRSHVQSFFQANRFLADDLAGRVERAVPEGGTVLDLYAGVGLFALTLAPRAERVLGVEGNAAAVEDAAYNARRARAGNVKIRAGDVREALRRWAPAAGERVVLDPPRSGAGAALVREIAARRPEAVVYVSCDPPTLARDSKTFDAEGYRLAGLEAVDMFPDTFHLEAVARFEPR